MRCLQVRGLNQQLQLPRFSLVTSTNPERIVFAPAVYPLRPIFECGDTDCTTIQPMNLGSTA